MYIEKEANGASGWVGALPLGVTDRSKIVELCAYTKVQLLKREKGRISFKVLDGNIAPGKELSMGEKSAPQYLQKLARGSGITLQIKYIETKKVISIPREGE